MAFAKVMLPPPKSSTVARKIGAKIAPRLKTLRHVGGCGAPRPPFAGVLARPFAGFASFRSSVLSVLAVRTVSFPSESISTSSYACRFSFARRRRCF
jgi:hypothetical protein